MSDLPTIQPQSGLMAYCGGDDTPVAVRSSATAEDLWTEARRCSPLPAPYHPHRVEHGTATPSGRNSVHRLDGQCTRPRNKPQKGRRRGVSSYAMSVIPGWHAAWRASPAVLKPGGRALSTCSRRPGERRFSAHWPASPARWAAPRFTLARGPW